MKKNTKKKDKKISWWIFPLLLLITIIGVGGYKAWKYLQPVYKIESRINNVEKEAKKRKELVMGWIKVQGTNIDYPIISSSDINVSTVLYDFAWTNNRDNKKLGNREILFGHNILNVSSKPLINNKYHRRFEQLMSFVYSDFAKENQYIQYTFNGNDYLYKIFAVSFIKNNELIKTIQEFNLLSLKPIIINIIIITLFSIAFIVINNLVSRQKQKIS